MTTEAETMEYFARDCASADIVLPADLANMTEDILRGAIPYLNEPVNHANPSERATLYGNASLYANHLASVALTEQGDRARWSKLTECHAIFLWVVRYLDRLDRYR